MFKLPFKLPLIRSAIYLIIDQRSYMYIYPVVLGRFILMDRSTIPTCLTAWDINVFIKMLTFAVCPHCIINRVIGGQSILHPTRSLHSSDVTNIPHSMGVIGGQTTLHYMYVGHDIPMTSLHSCSVQCVLEAPFIYYYHRI